MHKFVWWISYLVPILSLLGLGYLFFLIPDKSFINTETFLAVIVLTLFVFVIRQFWRISIHATITTSVWIALMKFVDRNFVWYGLVVLLICWTRIVLKKHTWAQVAAGCALTSLVLGMIW